MKPKNIIYQKSPLGIEYTELEEIRMKRVKNDSVEFMNKYGKGQQPTTYGIPIRHKND